MEEVGYIVRELRELEIYKDFKDDIEERLSSFRFASANDIARMLIIFTEGGFYLDNNAFVKEWDIQINLNFDFYGFSWNECDTYKITNNFAFGSKANHSIHSEYFRILKS